MAEVVKETRNLFQISEIKEKIMGDLVKSEDILKLLVNQGEDALAKPAPSPSEVLHKNIHPKSRSPQMLVVDQGNITMRISAVGNSDGYFRSYAITFFLLFPETMSYIVKDGRRFVREDYIAHLIDSIFDKKSGYGLGKLRFGAIVEADAPEGFDGLALTYESIDFA